MPLAYIGMGGNLPSWAGPPEATLSQAAERLGSLGRVTRRSCLYSTEPVGISDQPRFINAAVELETNLPPRALLDGLLAIEQEFGRVRTSEIRNGPRTLDLDVVLYGDAAISEPGLEIPHPRMADRRFVLHPLCDIEPSLIHPLSGLAVKELLQTLLRGKENGDDAPIPIQWNDWPARPCGSMDGRAASVRPDSLDSESDRNG